MKQRKDGRWLKQITIDGKRLAFYSTADTEKKAIKDIEQQMIAYKEKQNKGATFGSVVAEWRTRHLQKVSYNTAAKYENCLKRALDHFGDDNIKEISSLDIERYVDSMVESNFAKETVQVNLAIMRRLLEYAKKKNYIDNNVADDVEIPKGLRKTTREAPTSDERTTIINSLDKHFGLFAYLAIFTGLRRAELLALTWEDIDFANCILKVNKSIVYQHNQPIISPTKTKTSVRDVIIPEPIAEILEKRKSKGYIFGGQKPMTYQAFRRAYERYQKESGLKLTAHQLRHGYATLLYEASVDVKSAQALLGHANISTTMDIYTHITAQKMQSEKNKLDSFIGNLK